MTHDELEEYINNFQPNQREVILKHILDSELLEKAFSTAEGKQILNSAVDLIASNVVAIVKNSVGGDSNRLTSEAAQEINTTYKLMTEWAKILIRGTEHKNKVK